MTESPSWAGKCIDVMEKSLVWGIHEDTGLDSSSAIDSLRHLTSHKCSKPMCPCVESSEVASAGIRS